MHSTVALMVIAWAWPLQEAITIAEGTTCSSCQIQVEEVATLGGSDGDELLADMMGDQVVRDAEGAYWLFSYTITDVLWRFAADGHARLVGAPGQGPSEINRIVGLGVTASGGVLAVDLGNSRLVSLDSAGVTGAVVYHREGRSVSDIELLAEDTVLFATMSRLPQGEGFGVPVHAVSLESGRVVGSLGAPVDEYQPQLTERGQERRLSVRGRRVVTSHMWRYQLDVFDWPTRAMTKSIIREAPWFPIVNLLQVNPPRTRPASRVVGVEVTSDSTVLVLSRRPRPNWLAAYSETRRTQEGERLPASSAMVFEAVVEHLDIKNGDVLSRAVVSGSPMNFVSGSEDLRIAILRDEEIIPRVHIYSLRILN